MEFPVTRVSVVEWTRSSDADVRRVALGDGRFFAYLITLHEPYLWEIILPGAIVGLILGFATARFGGLPRSSTV